MKNHVNLEIKQDWFPRKDKVAIYTSNIDYPEMDKQIIKEIREQGDRQGHKTNVKAQMTDWHMSDKDGFKELVHIVKNIISQISSHQYNRPDVQYQISDIWGMIYKKDEYAINHDHYPACWSVVYYVQAPEGSGALHFPELDVKRVPENGLLIIFPGDIKHEALPTTTDIERIVVAMNLKDL